MACHDDNRPPEWVANLFCKEFGRYLVLVGLFERDTRHFTEKCLAVDQRAVSVINRYRRHASRRRVVNFAIASPKLIFDLPARRS
jgi:hypothetical protein